jgi:hypothetical protein
MLANKYGCLKVTLLDGSRFSPTSLHSFAGPLRFRRRADGRAHLVLPHGRPSDLVRVPPVMSLPACAASYKRAHATCAQHLLQSIAKAHMPAMHMGNARSEL